MENQKAATTTATPEIQQQQQQHQEEEKRKAEKPQKKMSRGWQIVDVSQMQEKQKRRWAGKAFKDLKSAKNTQEP